MRGRGEGLKEIVLLSSQQGTRSAYPHSKGDDFQHTLNAKQCGEGCIHVMQSLLIHDALLVVLRRDAKYYIKGVWERLGEESEQVCLKAKRF